MNASTYVTVVALMSADDVPTLYDLMERPDWQRQAACRKHRELTWFPSRGEHVAFAAAKAVCSGCPVQTECLTAALDEGVPDGIWGGLSANERRQLRVRG